jgi:hypothetical protein
VPVQEPNLRAPLQELPKIGDSEVLQDCLAAPLIGKEVSDLESALAPDRLSPYLLPQDSLLSFPLWATDSGPDRGRRPEWGVRVEAPRVGGEGGREEAEGRGNGSRDRGTPGLLPAPPFLLSVEEE